MPPVEFAPSSLVFDPTTVEFARQWTAAVSASDRALMGPWRFAHDTINDGEECDGMETIVLTTPASEFTINPEGGEMKVTWEHGFHCHEERLFPDLPAALAAIRPLPDAMIAAVWRKTNAVMAKMTGGWV